MKIPINTIKESAMMTILTAIKKPLNKSIDLSENKLVLVTAAGTISGYPLLEEDTEENSGNLIFSVFSSDIKQNAPSSYSPLSMITLKDVTLICGNGSVQNFSQLSIFTEDIIGISISG